MPFAHDASIAELHLIHPGGAAVGAQAVAQAIDQEHNGPGEAPLLNAEEEAPFPYTVALEAFR